MADNSEIRNTQISAANDEVKKVKKSTIKKPVVKPNHPPTAQMVDSAIKTLKERGGSSLLAIKKYLAANYKVDTDKLAPFIKKYLKSSVENGRLIQTKGKGASGSFKLSAAAAKPKKEIKHKAIKLKAEKKLIKKTGNKKINSVSGEKKKVAAAGKKQSSDKKKSVSKLVKKSSTVKSKTPKQKSTKPSKTDIKKVKTPKPKKAISAKKVSVKKISKK